MTSIYKRFNIEVRPNDEYEKLVNRIQNMVWDDFLTKVAGGEPGTARYDSIASHLVSHVGARYFWATRIDGMLGDDVWLNLEALEEFARYCRTLGKPQGEEIGGLIEWMLIRVTLDIGIRWDGEKFLPAGAQELDKALVNEPLAWLQQKGLDSVRAPFEKSLRHLLQAHAKPEFLPDVVTDCYEALEALAKIVSGREGKDLSANKEQFLSKVNASEHYKHLLSKYIVYANAFRHAAAKGKPKPAATYKEIESFVYLTGLFLRLAMPSAPAP